MDTKELIERGIRIFDHPSIKSQMVMSHAFDGLFAAREEIAKMEREIADLKSFIKGVGIQCERVTK